RTALAARRQSHRLPCHERVGSVAVAARGAAGRCEHDAPAQRPRHRLRLVPERALDRLPRFEREARRHRRRDEEGAQALEAPASLRVVECRVVAELAAAAGGLAAAAPLVLSKRPVASPDRRREAAPRSRLLNLTRRKTPTPVPGVGAGLPSLTRRRAA